MSINNNSDLLEEIMATKSDAELNEYLTEIEKCDVMELGMAVAEMKKRGRVFSDTEWENILSEVRLKIWGKNPYIPIYYSPKAIFFLSFFFSVLFGAIILSINLDNRREKYIVIGFGFIYLFLQYTLATVFPSNAWFNIGFHVIGCLTPYTLFWRKYIGANHYYHKQKVELIIPKGIMFLTMLLWIKHFLSEHCDSHFAFCLGKDLGTMILELYK